MVPGSWTDRPATNLVLLDEVGLAGPFIRLVKWQEEDNDFTSISTCMTREASRSSSMCRWSLGLSFLSTFWVTNRKLSFKISAPSLGSSLPFIVLRGPVERIRQCWCRDVIVATQQEHRAGVDACRCRRWVPFTDHCWSAQVLLTLGYLTRSSILESHCLGHMDDTDCIHFQSY